MANLLLPNSVDAPEALLDTYEEERRPVAASMLGLSTRLLDGMKKGNMRRGREVHQLDIGYPHSSLAVQPAEREGRLLAGDRAPDATVRDASGHSSRLFKLFQGAHWTLLGYEVERGSLKPAAWLHIHRFGPGGDLVDDQRQFNDAYNLDHGEWVLVRPDGYVGAIFTDVEKLHGYLAQVGLSAEAF